MTRKDYIELAECLVRTHKILGKGTTEDFIATLTEVIKRRNTNFKPDVFLKYIGDRT